MTALCMSGAMVEGKATYVGGAAGKYALLGSPAGSAGHFTAEAMLEVDFDADLLKIKPSGNDTNGVSISGMIDNFMTGDVSRDDWSVALTWDRDGGTEGVQETGS